MNKGGAGEGDVVGWECCLGFWVFGFWGFLSQQKTGGVMSIAAMAMAQKSKMKATGNLDKLMSARPSKQELAEKNILKVS